MANLTVHIALDLGSDTMKVAYAYNDGRHFTGKIVDDPRGMTAIPSVAYYDTDENKWLFGDQVDSVGDKPFITVVKICDLLRLLQSAESEAVQKQNRNYYFKKREFPKFYFPQREMLTDNIDAACKLDRTFGSDRTPAEVCEGFFAYIVGVVRARLDKLFKGKVEYTVSPSLLYPPFSEGEYIDELKRLVKKAFGTQPKQVMSMAKALCAFAKYSDRMSSNDKAIIFNIGEERISLVKVTFARGGISVDGVDGHTPPEQIGGKDIDDAVARYIEEQMSGRETMGRPSSGEDGHIAESALNTKQYLFVKDIKSAKIVLGMPIYESKAFSCGVPISASRDLLVQRSITREQFVKCIGITDDAGIARKFVDYIKREISLPLNSDVKKIFITGGPVETYGLVPYIRAQIEKSGVKVLTFEKDDAEYVGVENNGYNVMSHEDAVYAPALGLAVAALTDMQIDMVLALSYGIRLFRGVSTGGRNAYIPFFKVIVDKGTRIPQAGATYYTPADDDPGGITTGDDSDESAPLHIMSTFFSAEDIRHSRKAPTVAYHSSSGDNILIVDTDNADMMKKLQREIGLRVLNGDIDDMDNGARAKYFYKNRQIRIIEEIYLILGVEIDADGRATAFARNDKLRNADSGSHIVYLDGAGAAGNELGPSGGGGGGGYNVDPFAKNTAYASRASHGDAYVYKRDIDFSFKIETHLT